MQVEPVDTPTGAVFDVQLSPRVLRHVTQLKGNFTKFDSKEYGNFRSQYSHRLYELLCQRENLGTWDVQVDELRSVLGAEAKYDRFTQFRDRVLTPAREEIEEKTDLRFEMDERRLSRKIDRVIFTITRDKAKGRPS